MSNTNLNNDSNMLIKLLCQENLIYRNMLDNCKYLGRSLRFYQPLGNDKVSATNSRTSGCSRRPSNSSSENQPTSSALLSVLAVLSTNFPCSRITSSCVSTIRSCTRSKITAVSNSLSPFLQVLLIIMI